MKAILPAALALCCSVVAKPIDLSGTWRFALDAGDRGLGAGPDNWKFPDRIRLPGILTAQGFGEKPSFTTAWTGDGWRYPDMFKEWQDAENFKFPFFLQPPLHYTGPAWYQRDIEIPQDWKARNITLHLERVHWRSMLWLDGKEIGAADSLGTPHTFDLGVLSPGGHVLTLRVDNRLTPVNIGPLSHSVTDHTQGNWNGVVGKIELRDEPLNRITGLRVDPFPEGRLSIRVNGRMEAGAKRASITARIEGHSARKSVTVPVVPDGKGSFTTEAEIVLDDKPLPWNEFEPNLYQVHAGLSVGDEAAVHETSTSIGFRELGTREGRITLNGTKIFLRGTLECCIFPLTGHPPMDVESWKRIIRICKAHGLNHIRFHSWCPPEAAFTAADELGFYYQVEASSWANDGADIGGGAPSDAWIEAESKRMTALLGNHPSFMLFAYGNEPAGEHHKTWLRDWVARRKAEDRRHLVTTGAGWPILPGSDFHSSPEPRLQEWNVGLKSPVNRLAPSTDFDWRDFVRSHPDAPIVSHEIGQWCAYPNFREIPKYTGYFKARNFEIFRETAARAGLLEQAEDFLMASGKWQAAMYKHDIEAALRTPGFGGFQLLDLHDFPGQGTALVGVLDAFWDEKGYIRPEEYRRFCGPVVPLARLKKMVFTTDETLEADLEVAQFGPGELKQCLPVWKLRDAKGTTLAAGELPRRDLTSGELHALDAIKASLSDIPAPAKLILDLELGGQSNSWEVFVYPAKSASSESPDVLVTRDWNEARTALRKGGSVLWTPPASSVRDDKNRPLIAGFSPIFWNTAWTKWQAPHTLGILCDPRHPALADFPTDFHSNWQWWEVQQNARPFILSGLRDVKPIVQIIDDWFTQRKLGYVFEAKVEGGRLIACSADLSTDLENRHVARQLRTSLVKYMTGESFQPKLDLTATDIAALIE